jgi:hypothetical protein
MALRILPFRQYDEKDVVNLYALQLDDGASLDNPSANGDNDAGVFVKVTSADLNAGPVEYVDNSYLGKTDYPHIGRDQYPVVPLKIQPASGGNDCLGMTMYQTANYDENGEKLLYYPVKKDEMQAVLSGEAVPVATKGVFTLANSAVDGDLTPGSPVALSANAGKVTGASHGDANDGSTTIVGSCLASGSRTAIGTADQFAGAAGSTGNYYVVKINL